MKVFKSKNPSQFKSVIGNRDIDENHVRRLMKSILEHGYYPHSPIEVNEKGEITDGQHRLEALRRLAKKGRVYEFYYIRVVGATLADCIASNEFRKNWNNDNYIKAYALDETCENREDYQTLRDLMSKFSEAITLTMLCNVCMCMNNMNVVQILRSGRFKIVRDYDEVVRICEYLYSIKDALKTMQTRNTYTRAIIWCLLNDEIDSEALRYQINKYYSRFTKITKVDEALRQLSDVYHYNDRRTKKLTPARNFYSLYDEEFIKVKEERRVAKMELMRAKRAEEKVAKKAEEETPAVPEKAVLSCKSGIFSTPNGIIDTRAMMNKTIRQQSPRPIDFSKVHSGT